MSLFNAFVTLEEVAEYITGTNDTSSLPSNTSVLIQRASELIAIAMRNNYNPKNEGHVEVVKLATCAQVQDWLKSNNDGVSNDNVSSYSLGELSVTFNDPTRFENKVCMTSIKYLNKFHLLFKGVM